MSRALLVTVCFCKSRYELDTATVLVELEKKRTPPFLLLAVGKQIRYGRQLCLVGCDLGRQTMGDLLLSFGTINRSVCGMEWP